MRALFYQPSCGIAGDMHIAALIELGVPEQYLRDQLQKLTLSAEFQLTLNDAVKMGISGTHAKVTTEDQHDHRHHSVPSPSLRLPTERAMLMASLCVV